MATFTVIASPNTQPRSVVIRRRRWASLHQGSGGWRAGIRYSLEILGLAWVGLEAGLVTGVGGAEVCDGFLFGR